MSVQAILRHDTEKQNHYGKYVKWHLFKGGVKTHLLDEIQNPSVFNQVCVENENMRE